MKYYSSNESNIFFVLYLSFTKTPQKANVTQTVFIFQATAENTTFTSKANHDLMSPNQNVVNVQLILS